MDVVRNILVNFGTEIVIASVVFGVRWFEKRWMNSKFRKKLKEKQSDI